MHLLKKQSESFYKSAANKISSGSNNKGPSNNLQYDSDLMAQLDNTGANPIRMAAPRSSGAPNSRFNTTYHVEVSLKYQAEPDAQICLLGKIPELSMWKKESPQCWMKRTEGDIWVTEKPLITNQFYFTTKFAVYDKSRKNFQMYENGIDRIFDCELKEAAPAKHSRDFYESRSVDKHQTELPLDNIKRVEMNCTW